MSTTIVDYGGVIQSGRTTMMIGALLMLHQMGARVIYVAPTLDMATEVAKKFKIPFRYHGIRYDSLFDTRYSAIAIDDIRLIAPGLFAPFYNRTLNLLSTQIGPTQLLIAR